MSPSDLCLLTVETQDGYSELYLEDQRYNVIAKDIGRLSIQVPPGIYRIRQRIGGQERCELLDVRPEKSNVCVLEALPFASPIPLTGVRAPQPSQQTVLGSTERTAPGTGSSSFTLLLRDSSSPTPTPPSSALKKESGRLQIESLDGTFTKPLDEIGQLHFDAGYLRICIGLKPGPYRLTQLMPDGLRRHLMLPIQQTWCLHVFMELPPPGSSPPDLDLDRAALVYAKPTTILQPDDSNLALLEVARKALARGRADVAPEIVNRVLVGKWGNPILGLIGSYLLLSAASPDVALAKLIIDRTSQLLGNTFPDIIALQIWLNRIDPTQPLPKAVPTHPPLLAASWTTLLASDNERGLDNVSHLFPSPFTVESTTTWFVWNEVQDRRSAGPISSGGFGIAPQLPSGRTADRSTTPLPQVIQTLLEHKQLQPWLRDLKNTERAGKDLPEGLTALDRDLLAALSSAQASLIPGVIEAETAANTIVRGLHVPASTARDSAVRLATELERWIARAGVSLRIHPLVDDGVRQGDANFAGGTLLCQCVQQQVAIAISSNFNFNHLCGCTKCWRPPGALFALTGVVPRKMLNVIANGQKLKVVDPGAAIQRHACTVCGVHMYGRIENKVHPFYGFDFVHPELCKEQGWAAPTFAAFVSSIIELGFPPVQMPAVRARLRELHIEPYDCLSPELMDAIAMHTAKNRGESAA